MIIRTLVLLLLVVPRLHAQEERDEFEQVYWSDTWNGAFQEAKDKKRVVMVCFNSKDGESANERAAKTTYRDTQFIALSRKFVMVVISIHKHRETAVCPRFGRITCKQHNDCFKDLQSAHLEKFMLPGTRGEMISPQHAFFRPDGTLLRRKEYELFKPQLLAMMREALAEWSTEAGIPLEDDGDLDRKNAPLTAREKAEVERVKTGSPEARKAALANLLATEKTAAIVAIAEIAKKAKEDLRCDIIAAFGRARTLQARPFLEDQTSSKSKNVRSFSYVALENLAQEISIDVLIKRVRREKDAVARKNAYRALGVCAGAAAHKKGAKAMLNGLKDKQKMVAKHAALGMRAFRSEEAKKLVVGPMEKALKRTKGRDVRGGLMYTLAHIGNKETTLPIFRAILKETNDDYAKSFVLQAIGVLKGDGNFGRAAYFVFWEDRSDPARQD